MLTSVYGVKLACIDFIFDSIPKKKAYITGKNKTLEF